jgi:GR25 family glycosyltransferase involved in LPS biosynthesis
MASIWKDKHIGITYYVGENGSIFGSSRGQTALMLRKMLEALEANVTLVHCSTSIKFWDDAAGLEGNCISLVDCSGLDLLIDIDATLSGEIRKKIAKKTVGFLRGRVLFNEIENSSYLQQNIVRLMDNLNEIWFWDIFNPEEDLGPLASLFQIPTRRLPFIWEPFIVANYLKLSGLEDSGISNTYRIPELSQSLIAPTEAKPKTFHIAEKNTSNTSSAVLPLIGLVELSKKINFNKIIVNNGESLKDTPFYKTNIMPNLKFPSDVEIIYTGRERFADWLEENVFVITHCRYIPFRYSMLDLAYLGIPFVHNSVVLKDMNVIGYYSNNSISEMCETILGYTQNKERPDFSCWSVETQKERWLDLDFDFDSDIQEIKAQNKNPEPRRQKIKLGFANMWEGFNPSRNFFVDLLNHNGYDTTGTDELTDIDLLIFGPFFKPEAMLNVSCPKVFFTGEYIECPFNADLYLTFNPKEDDTHIRLPLWMLFVNWFGTDICEEQNPQTLPVELLTQSHHIGFDNRPEEFSFVVSNPSNEIRNEIFYKLSEKYKVNSGGRLYNNIGGPLKCLYGGGGAGDIEKHKFLEKHKFNICFENSKGPGYVTEKLLHAKLAGCVPLYWGAPEALEDFLPEGFINLSDCQDVETMMEKISGILASELACGLARTPALDTQRFLAAKNKLSHVAERLINLAKPEPDKYPTPVFLSYVTSSYVDAILHNIKSLNKMRDTLPDLRFIVYLAQDITEDDIRKLTKYNWIELIFMDKYFEPKYFGWKLYILQKTVNDKSLKNNLIIYTDAGAQWLNLPNNLLQTAYSKGLCFLLDPDNNTNEQWCSKEMQEEYKLTEEELAARQILAGFHVFKAGHPLPVAVYNEAVAAAANPTILEGDKYIKLLPDGRPHGHRHDQSILSTLRLRFNVPSLPADKFINEKSLRLATLSNSSIYLHRGQHTTHRNILNKIDDIWIINLDRRPDRLQSLYESCDFLKSISNRFSAIDGKKLQLTPSICKLIENNDFIWKKSVTAVALSHILLWAQLVAEDNSVNSYLILEDDVRFSCNEWPSYWTHLSKSLPKDAELAYLGGILPSNKSAYKHCIESVNNYWATIKPNEFFSPGNSEPIFHFCAYSYIITKSGAKKLLDMLEQIGCFTSIDHFLGHPMFGLKKYVLNNLLTSCFQEDDPTYVNSQFDNFSRVDSFDSDIWNNVEVWSEEEQKNKLSIRPSIKKLVSDVLNQVPSNVITQNIFKWKSNSYLPVDIFYKKSYNSDIISKLNELHLYYNPIEYSDAMAAAVEPWFYIEDESEWVDTLDKYNKNKIHFNVIYNSNKTTTISDFEYCKHIVRFDFIKNTKTINIPLYDVPDILLLKHAIDNDTIPFYIRTEGDSTIWNWLRENLHCLELQTEEAQQRVIDYFKKNNNAELTYLNGLKENLYKWINTLHIVFYG